MEKLFYSLILFLMRTRHLQSGGKLQGLSRSEMLEQDIILHHIASDGSEGLAVEGSLVIDSDLA